MEPASHIIRALGGNAAVARILGVSPSRVAAWKQPFPHGTGGAIPLRHIGRLLQHARQSGVELSAEAFIPDAGIMHAVNDRRKQKTASR